MDRSQDVVPMHARSSGGWAAAAGGGGGGGGGAAPIGGAVDAALPGGLSLTGLRNEAGEYNCFLNVVVQCLWRCGQFRHLVRGRGHVPCFWHQSACYTRPPSNV